MIDNQTINKIRSAESAFKIMFDQRYHTIGIGTGSTVDQLLELIANSSSSFRNRTFVSSSKRTHNKLLESSMNTHVVCFDDVIDLYIDGADWVDSEKRMIKGYGGAMNLERECLQRSKRIIIMVDSSKLCKSLTDKFVPVEFYADSIDETRNDLIKIFKTVEIMRNKDHSMFRTDLGNMIFLCCDFYQRAADERFEQFDSSVDVNIKDYKQSSIGQMIKMIEKIPTVVCHGLFIKEKAICFDDYTLVVDGKMD